MRLVTRCAAGPKRCSESQREHETQAARLPVFGGWPGISQARPHLTTSSSRVALRVAAVWLRRGLTLYIESRTHRRKTAGRFLGCFIASVCAAPSHPSGDDRWTLPYAETGTLSRWAHNVSPSRCTTGTAPHVVWSSGCADGRAEGELKTDGHLQSQRAPRTGRPGAGQDHGCKHSRRVVRLTS
jgi:hypothetical protein